MIEAVLNLLKSLVKPLSEAFKVWFAYRAGRNAQKVEDLEKMQERLKNAGIIKSTLRSRDAKSINRVLQKYFRDE